MCPLKQKNPGVNIQINRNETNQQSVHCVFASMLFSRDGHQTGSAWRKVICPGNPIPHGMKNAHIMR